MDQDEAMKLDVDEAAKQLSPKALEYLFQPRNLFEILARSDPAGTQVKVNQWKIWAVTDGGMPAALAKEWSDEMERILATQTFYRKVKAIHDHCIEQEIAGLRDGTRLPPGV